jgi:hypothetical protein
VRVRVRVPEQAQQLVRRLLLLRRPGLLEQVQQEQLLSMCPVLGLLERALQLALLL